MKKILLLLALFSSAIAGNATTTIYYSVSGGTSGTPWSGQINVLGLDSLACSNNDTQIDTISISANGRDPLTFVYFGSGGSWSSAEWQSWTPTYDAYIGGLYVNSSALYNVINPGEWTGTWYDVVSGQSYALETVDSNSDPLPYSAKFEDPNGTLSLMGGGLITFGLTPESIGSGGAIPEPSTYAAIFGSVILGFAAIFRRKRKVA